VELNEPRTRDTSLTSVTVLKGTRWLGEFDHMVLSLYTKGLTPREIAEHLHAAHGACVSQRDNREYHRRVNDRGQGMAVRAVRGSSTSTRSGCGSATAARSGSRPATWPSGLTWKAGTGCWGSGSSRARAPGSGPRG
jgi:hypothetical protein